MRSLLPLLLIFSFILAAQDSWEERALRQLDKKLSAEMVDTKLSEAMSFVSQFSGLNIIINPKVLQSNPVVNIRVKDMDVGNFIKWLTKLTDTYAEVVNQAIYITDKPSEEAAESEKEDLMMLAASLHAEITLPPKGVELTDADRFQIAMKLIEKLEVKPTDFPGPDIGIGLKETPTITNPFQPK